MQRFIYSAIEKSGKKTKGLVEAISEERAIKILREKNLFVCSLKLKEKKPEFSNFLANFGRVSGREIATFTRVLGTMTRAGLSLTSALESLMIESSNLKFKKAIDEINKKVQGGSSLANALRSYPNFFSELYVSLVEAGETAGNLDKVLEKLADTLEASESLKAKIRNAMIYPIIIALVMLGIGSLMLIMVIPKISEVYQEMEATLPLPTQILISLSNLITNFWWLVAISILAVFFLISQLRKNQHFDYLSNNLMLRMPILGPMMKESILALFTRTLGTLLKSGIAILKSLKITAKTLGNNFYRKVILDATTQVEKGTSLSLPLHASGVFPAIVTQMIAAGEETGTIDESLLRLADFFDEAVDRKVKGLTSVLEPIMIVIMGAAVGGLAIAVLLPMFNLVNVIK